MSHYITDLRRELVSAADRQTAPAAPVRRVVGAGRFAGPVLALAAVVAAIVIAAGWLRTAPPQTPSVPSRPQITATFAVAGKPAGAVVDPAGGRMWVLRAHGGLVAVDRTGQRLGRIGIGDLGAGLAASDRHLWVISSGDGGCEGACGFGRHHHGVERVDPDTGQRERVRGLGELTGLPPIAAGAPQALYLQRDVQGAAHAPLTRIDARGAHVTGAYASAPLGAITVTGDRVWTISRDGRLQWRDLDSGAVLGTRDGFAALPDLVTTDSLAPAPGGGVFVSTGADGKVTRLDADGRTLWSADVDANGPMTAADGSVWTATASPTGAAPPQIARLDATNGRLTERLPLEGDAEVLALLGVRDEMWAVFNDGTVIVLR